MCALLVEDPMNLSDRLKNIERRVESLEKALHKKSFKRSRDDRWEEFVRIMKVQERNQKVNLP